MLAMLRYVASPIAIVMLFALGLSFVGAGVLAPGESCAFRLRSVFQGTGIDEAALLVEAANRPVLPLRSDIPEAPAMLEISDPRTRSGEADLEEIIPAWTARSGARRIFEVRNLGGAASVVLRGRFLLHGNAPLVLVENSCLGPLVTDASCRLVVETRPLSPGPFAGEIVVLPANPNAPFDDLRTEGAARTVRGTAEGLPVALLSLAVVHDFPIALVLGQACRFEATPERIGPHRLRLGPGLSA